MDDSSGIPKDFCMPLQDAMVHGIREKKRSASSIFCVTSSRWEQGSVGLELQLKFRLIFWMLGKGLLHFMV